jgi:hypothetical protein
MATLVMAPTNLIRRVSSVSPDEAEQGQSTVPRMVGEAEGVAVVNTAAGDIYTPSHRLGPGSKVGFSRVTGRVCPSLMSTSCYSALKRPCFLASSFLRCSFSCRVLKLYFGALDAFQHDRSAEPIETGWLVTPVANS